MNMHSVNVGANKYCGPAVLSILTGKSTDDCARVISSINGSYKVEGVKTSHLLEAAARLGFDNEPVDTAQTLFGTLNRLSHRDGIYIVTVTGHFVVVEVNAGKIYFCDNHTKQVMPAAASARMMQACISAHLVTKRRDPVLVNSKIIAKRIKADTGYCVIGIVESITYDIPKYDRINTIAKIRFNTEEDFRNFVKELNDETI